MERFYGIESQIAQHSKQAKEILESEQRIVREKESLALQRDQTKRLQYLETKFQAFKDERAKELMADHIRRQKEKQADRWFQAFLLIAGAALGVLGTKLADIFFK
ncbi:hypothetical protein GCM10027049_03780 [Mucilaginibacter puniceus]